MSVATRRPSVMRSIARTAARPAAPRRATPRRRIDVSAVPSPSVARTSSSRVIADVGCAEDRARRPRQGAPQHARLGAGRRGDDRAHEVERQGAVDDVAQPARRHERGEIAETGDEGQEARHRDDRRVRGPAPPPRAAAAAPDTRIEAPNRMEAMPAVASRTRGKPTRRRASASRASAASELGEGEIADQEQDGRHAPRREVVAGDRDHETDRPRADRPTGGAA